MYPNKYSATIVLLLLQTLPTFSQDFYGISLAGQQQIGRKKLIIHHIGQCMDQKDLPIFLPVPMRVAPTNSTTSAVSGTITFREDFPTGWDVSVTIRKCDNFRPDADCRPYMNHLVNTNQCTVSRMFVDFSYMKYLKKLTPKAECPFRKGNYTLGETPVDDELVKYWDEKESERFLPGVGATYWKVEMIGKVDERMVLCVSLQLNVKPKKNVKKLP